MDMRCKSFHDHRYSQIFATKEFFVDTFPIDKKSECHESLKEFVNKYGAPLEMISDGVKEQTGRKTQFSRILNKHDIHHRITEPERHNQNPCEGVIRELVEAEVLESSSVAVVVR